MQYRNIISDTEYELLARIYAFILSWPDPDTIIADSEQPLAGVSESAESDAPPQEDNINGES